MIRCRTAVLAVSLSALTSGIALHAQKVYTADDYRKAERWMSYNTQPLVKHTIAGIEFLPDGRLFYRDPNGTATVYMLADPAKGTTAPAFDNAKLARALQAASGYGVDANHPGISHFQPEANGGFSLELYKSTYHCNAAATVCKPEPPPTPAVQHPEQTPSAEPPATGICT